MPVLGDTRLLPLTVLVQGGIASGKSTIAGLLVELGAIWIDCDRLAHQALDTETVRAEVREAFGQGVFDPTGAIVRQALAEVAFRDPAMLAKLEAIVHPRVLAGMQETLAGAQTVAGSKRKVVVIDAPVAEKAGLAASFDLKLFVDSALETRQRRAQQSRGWQAGEIERREAQQKSLYSKQKLADYVVPNDGELAEAERHVKRFWTELVEPRR